MSWQEPDGLDAALAHPPIRDFLRPVAEALTAAPATQRWSTPVNVRDQHEVVFADPDAGAHRSVPPASLREWRAETLADERGARERPADPRANWGGRWWSTPVFAGLTSATRSLPPGGPVGLSLIEDSLGWTEASSYLLEPSPPARILETTTPADWAHLAATYPLQVTRSRLHDWWRTTGSEGPWIIPEYLAVAANYDAIHLTVVGYLATAGRALPTPSGGTVLAGWDPDQTFRYIPRPLLQLRPRAAQERSQL